MLEAEEAAAAGAAVAERATVDEYAASRLEHLIYTACSRLTAGISLLRNRAEVAEEVEAAEAEAEAE